MYTVCIIPENQHKSAGTDTVATGVWVKNVLFLDSSLDHFQQNWCFASQSVTQIQDFTNI